MGLDIFYDLHARKHWGDDEVRSVVERARQFTTTLGFAKVTEVFDEDPNEPNSPATLYIKDSEKKIGRFEFVRADRGWFFFAWPGKGCETARFGLCWFPAMIEHEGRQVRTGWGEGWHFQTWCKTQYADAHGRAHFFKCHLGVIAMLDWLKQAGVKANVHDDGDYWRTRDPSRLARKLDEMNALVAAVAGAFKDVLEDAPGNVVAPITDRNDFERLEAKGHELIREKRKRDGRSTGKNREGS